MSNLMITHAGALGDCMYTVPALNILHDHYDQIYQCGQQYMRMALGNTGLIDKFIIKPKEWRIWDESYQREWLLYQTQDMEWEAVVNLHGVVPGRLMFHSHDPKFDKSAEWKRKKNAGLSYFDEMTKRFESELNINLSCAYGKRPVTRHTPEEERWLRDFRSEHHIPPDAFMLGYQFAGSARIKWWPYFMQAIQVGIMQEYDDVYLVAMGDLKGTMQWDKKYHHGRYINLGSSISFRQAYILTSIMDLLISPETGVYVAAQAYQDTPKILLATHTDGTHITCGDESIILTPECDCAPCYNLVSTCDMDDEINAPRCIASIKPGRVIEEVDRIIARKRRMDSLRIKPLKFYKPTIKAVQHATKIS